MELRARETNGKLRGARGIDRKRSTSGAQFGEARPESFDTGQRLPLAAMPTEGTIDFLPLLDTNECRNGFDLVVPRNMQVSVVARRLPFWEIGVVLGVDRKRRLFPDRFEDWNDQNTGRTVAFDEGNHAIGKNGGDLGHTARITLQTESARPFRLMRPRLERASRIPSGKRDLGGDRPPTGPR
jgi:hypothetical protein